MSTDQIEEIKKKLKDINVIITTLDPTLRDRALDTLWPLYFPVQHKSSVTASKSSSDSGGKQADTSSAEAFFTSFEQKKPHENVLMIAAWLYSQYGVFPIKPGEVKALASKAGLTVARRVDMTLKQAKEDGKALFSQANGAFEPTLSGEAFMKAEFSVKKGSLPRPKEDAE